MIKDKFSRVGFILAAAGSAVGIGNIWKFPYLTGDNGGGAFVLVYLLTILLIGISVFIAESFIGYKTNKDSVSAFESLALKNKLSWKFAGFSFLTALTILSFYVIVTGWILQYIVISLSNLPSNVQEAEEVFMELLTTDLSSQLIYFIISFLIIAFTVSRGIKDGIEKLNFILMPSLIVIMVGMLLYSMSFDSFKDAVYFMFYPNFDKFSSSSILVAIGQAFFTLSIGMAVILTYSSSLDESTNIVKSSIFVAIVDTIIALMAGLIIFTILFNAGFESSKGAGLVFITLPALFYELGAMGNIIAVAFFISLAFAALTSAVSILEPGVRYLEERINIPRKKSSLIISLVLSVIGFVALLSNLSAYSEALTFGSRNLFDWFDFISSAILLPLGGIATSLFVGFFIDQKMLKEHMMQFFNNEKIYNWWLFTIRYIVPISVGLVMVKELGGF